MTVTPKIDGKRELPTYTARRGRFDVVTVPPLLFLMIDGQGDPNRAPEYADALATIYPMAYGLKFLGRAELGQDHVVMPLEAMWWSDDLTAFTVERDKSRWQWTVMISVPSWVTDDHVDAVRGRLAARPATPPRLDDLRLMVFDEGLAVQTLHVGPYDDEGPVLAEMHDDVIPARSLRMTGRHHEIYLSDARRSRPERLRTILRQPVEPIPASAAANCG